MFRKWMFQQQPPPLLTRAINLLYFLIKSSEDFFWIKIYSGEINFSTLCVLFGTRWEWCDEKAGTFNLFCQWITISLWKYFKWLQGLLNWVETNFWYQNFHFKSCFEFLQKPMLSKNELWIKNYCSTQHPTSVGWIYRKHGEKYFSIIFSKLPT